MGIAAGRRRDLHGSLPPSEALSLSAECCRFVLPNSPSAPNPLIPFLPTRLVEPAVVLAMGPLGKSYGAPFFPTKPGRTSEKGRKTVSEYSRRDGPGKEVWPGRQRRVLINGIRGRQARRVGRRGIWLRSYILSIYRRDGALHTVRTTGDRMTRGAVIAGLTRSGARSGPPSDVRLRGSCHFGGRGRCPSYKSGQQG